MLRKLNIESGWIALNIYDNDCVFRRSVQEYEQVSLPACKNSGTPAATLP